MPGKLQNFVIALNDESAVFYAGQVLTGSIVLQLAESMNMRRIYLTLLGRAKVHWSEGGSKNRRHYRAEEVYFNDRIVVVGSESGEMTLPAGSHRYPFSVTLPQNLPSSYEGRYGYVRYKAEATIDRPWKFDHETRLAFTVICILDLNAGTPIMREPSTSEQEKDVSCCCCVSGQVTVKFTLNKRCFVPGETALISAEIQNQSTSSIDKTWVTLKQNVEFLGISESFFSSGNYKSHCISDTLSTVDKDDIIPAGETGYWNNVPFLIPATAPSRLVGCSIINVDYALKFHTDNGIKIPVDITIGTIPLRESYGVVTSQPSAPPVSETNVDVSTSIMSPPSYEECVQGRVTIREDGDSDFVRGDMNWAPKYPYYRQLSYPSQPC